MTTLSRTFDMIWHHGLREKTRRVNVLQGESFSFLGFDCRRVPNRSRTGYFILMTPKQKAGQT